MIFIVMIFVITNKIIEMEGIVLNKKKEKNVLNIYLEIKYVINNAITKNIILI